MALEKNYKEYLTVPVRSDRKPLIDLLPLKQPLRVLIDPCDICNFRCKFCFQSKEDFKGCKMSMEIFATVLEQLMEFEGPINVVHMYGLGEPLLNENLPFFIEQLKKNKVAKEVAITSNGSMLTHELSKELVAAGTDRLSISLNGIKEEHFKSIAGVHIDFKKMYEEIQFFYQIRENCHLHIKINGDDFSEEEKAEFVELFIDCTDSLNIDHVVNVWPGLAITESRDMRMYDYDLKNLKNEKQHKNPVCPLMFYELLIHSDGSVSPCAVDYGFMSQNLGNVKTRSLKNIWEGKQLLEMRRQSLQGEKIDYFICQNCMYTECAATVNITPHREQLLKKY